MSHTDPPPIRQAVGVMTGTSIDGIDAALVRIEGVGLDMNAALVRHISRPLANLAGPLRAAAAQQPMTASDFARLAWEFGNLHADVIGALLPLPLGEGRGEGPAPTDALAHPSLDLICVHGQTVFHQPPISWQLINPAAIAQRFNCPVVSDLRQADLAAGGQGAPITPLADWILFRDAHKRRAIINLGGFCNVTILPAKRAAASSPAAFAELAEIRGFDVCACNQVLDAVAREALGQPFDENGQAARAGRAKPQAAQALLEILSRQRAGRRSLGTGDEALAWVRNRTRSGGGDISAIDLAASAVEAISQSIAAALREHNVDEAIVAGGGAMNHTLLDNLARHAGVPIQLSDSLGVPIAAREAMCFAILGALCGDGVPITLPQVTGCRAPAPLTGTWCGPRCRWDQDIRVPQLHPSPGGAGG